MLVECHTVIRPVVFWNMMLKCASYLVTTLLFRYTQRTAFIKKTNKRRYIYNEVAGSRFLSLQHLFVLTVLFWRLCFYYTCVIIKVLLSTQIMLLP